MKTHHGHIPVCQYRVLDSWIVNTRS